DCRLRTGTADWDCRLMTADCRLPRSVGRRCLAPQSQIEAQDGLPTGVVLFVEGQMAAAIGLFSGEWVDGCRAPADVGHLRVRGEIDASSSRPDRGAEIDVFAVHEV